LSVSLFRNPRKAKQQKEKKKRKKNRNGAKRNETKKKEKRNETKKRTQTKEKKSTKEEKKRNEKKERTKQKKKKTKKKEQNETEASYCDLALCLGFVVDSNGCRFLRQVAILLRLLQWARAPVGPRGTVFAKTETPEKNGKNAERPEKPNTMEEAR
jgi:DNA mismatch repair ATPase MutL